ncbi:MAG: class II fructose-bisphosphatase [Anaerobiospirillum succiniciproducens]|uniref:class II fructose-bisphosphatase n=1 Tax=Anaerobiospirillum succiniciproducens TaxID=13335 RepID=UPI002A760D10|nr:class II fructose-bisphosphatase [Anaerobiospirillum succiniciproducens]MDY2797702.1 class II fructose-bisphosphatase [Anaerobiospirillum succiniciproducens]
MPVEQHLTDRNLALELVRVTEAGALAAARLVGRGEKEEADGAAVSAMRIAFQSVHIRGTVIIGEGEKDHAPMLYNGESVGYGDGPEIDIAVDPVEGTNAVAYGRPNGLAVIGCTPKGGMFNPGRSYYCKKLVVGKEAANVIDLDAPVADNLKKIAFALGKPVSELNIFVLDKPRHVGLINDIRIAGARIHLYTDGDVAGALMAADPRHQMDVLMGIGGTPEAVITACALKGTGAQMLTRLNPLSDEERKNIEADDISIDTIRSVDDLITSNESYFAATGITEGELLDGVAYRGEYAITSSMATRGRTGTTRYIQAWHNRKKLATMSSIRY